MKKTTRREILKTSLGFPAAALVGCSAGTVEPSEPSKPEMASETKMKLAMSVRVAESFHNKEESSMTIDQLIGLAKRYGYQALCMRASQAGVHTPKETVQELSQAIRDSGLVVSMVTGDFAVPRNDERGPDLLRNITPYLDLAETFGAGLIRVCMKTEDDISWAQKASDEARERRIRLAHQAHLYSLFETIEGSLQVLKAVDRSNFGLIYEPANWFVAGEEYGRETIKTLQPYIFNVYVQNHRLNEEGEAELKTWKMGPVRVDHIGIWEEGGVDFHEVFEALHEIDYEGYVTVHQSFQGIMSVEEAVEKSGQFLESLIQG